MIESRVRHHIEKIKKQHKEGEINFSEITSLELYFNVLVKHLNSLREKAHQKRKVSLSAGELESMYEALKSIQKAGYDVEEIRIENENDRFEVQFRE